MLKRGSVGELSPADKNAPTARLELATTGSVTARANSLPIELPEHECWDDIFPWSYRTVLLEYFEWNIFTW